MTNNSKAHEAALVANLWRQSKRKDVYHVLLREMLSIDPDDDEGECLWCGNHLDYSVGEPHNGLWTRTYSGHTATCPYARAERALAADADGIAALMRELTGQDSGQ